MRHEIPHESRRYLHVLPGLLFHKAPFPYRGKSFQAGLRRAGQSGELLWNPMPRRHYRNQPANPGRCLLRSLCHRRRYALLHPGQSRGTGGRRSQHHFLQKHVSGRYQRRWIRHERPCQRQDRKHGVCPNRSGTCSAQGQPAGSPIVGGTSPADQWQTRAFPLQIRAGESHGR